MVSGTGHDHTLDWWTLGILIYEMLVGIPPFYNSNKNKMYFLIETGAIRWPSIPVHGFEISQSSIDLISKLLIKDKKLRLGRENDLEDIISHEWFSTIDTEKLMER